MFFFFYLIFLVILQSAERRFHYTRACTYYYDTRTYIYKRACVCREWRWFVINGGINYGQSDDVDNKTEIQFPSWSLFTVWK